MLITTTCNAVRNHSIVSSEMMPGICRIERLFPRLERCDWILVVNTNLQHSGPQRKSAKGKQLHILIVLLTNKLIFNAPVQFTADTHPSQKQTAFCKLAFKVKIIKQTQQWTIFLKPSCLSWLEWEHEHQLSTSHIVFFLLAEVLLRVHHSYKVWHSYTRQCITRLWFYRIWKVWSKTSLSKVWREKHRFNNTPKVWHLKLPT